MLANGASWHEILSLLALTSCWKELFKQTCMECQLVHTFQIWILPMMSLYLSLAELLVLLISYLHLRRWHKSPHLSGSRWTVRRQDYKHWTAGRMNHQQPQSRAGGCSGWRVCLSWLSWYLMSTPLLVYDCAESRQSDLEVKVNNFNVNQVEALYNTCVLPIFLYGSWAVTKRDLLIKINDLNQCCLRKLLGIK